jgi:arylsulfatase A-like enzyme
VSTILSGVAATRHGRFLHGDPDDGLLTVAQLLPSTYRTAGFVNNGNLQPQRGFDRGFDEYEYSPDWDVPFSSARTSAATAGDEPTFLLLHSNLPHDYGRVQSRALYEERFPERRDWFQMQPHLITWAGLSPAQRRRVRSFYDANVARLDVRLSDLVDSFDPTTTILCITADHGEGFDYGSGRLHHAGRVHDDLINVPLCVHLPPAVEEMHGETLRRRRSTPMSSADILPTLFDLVGLAVPEGLDGRSVLAPVEPDRVIEAEDRRFLYVPSRHRLNVNRDGKNTTRATRLRNRVLQRSAGRQHNVKAFIQGDHKLIVTSFVPPPAVSSVLGPVVRRLAPVGANLRRYGDWWVALELFDVVADPGERHNLLSERSGEELAAFLRQKLPSLDRFTLFRADGERALVELLAAAS